MNILNDINFGKKVKDLTIEEKTTLCEEIRETIINTVATNGGHLASNLGTVELAVALFSSFDFPNDTVVWDVGHQCYAHKLLSGRYDVFSTLRQENGMSGFPNRDESKYDPFTTGHSSASISSAFGINTANDILDNKKYSIAVIGDGALTGGLAYEALNNAGRIHKNFIVIINENNMSISKNVGAMSRHLTYLRAKKGYVHAKVNIREFFEKTPVVGKSLSRFSKKMKRLVKRSFYNSTIFEDMGFTYYGPYDGHDIEHIEHVLDTVKELNYPVIIHLKTTKGKGYAYAEDNPKAYHGVSGFDIPSGAYGKMTGENFSSVFGNKLIDIAEQNEKICAITAAMKAGTGLIEFSRKFKNRFFDVGIAEAHAVTYAGGLAYRGLIPVFAVYSTFLQRAYDSLVHDVALQNLKVILAVDRAGLVGDDGKTHQGVFDVSFLKSIPNATIFSPTYYEELRYSMDRAVSEDYSLVAVRYPRGSEGYKADFECTDTDYTVYGKESDICIVTYGRTFCEALRAVEILGIPIKIVKLNKILPIDKNAVLEASISKNILFVEEAVSGISDLFGRYLHDISYRGDYNISDIENGFVKQASMQSQLAHLGLDSNGIIRTINDKFLKG